MNPIKYLLDWRLDNFLKEYDIELEDFNKSKHILTRKQSFKHITNQLLPCTSYTSGERIIFFNYAVCLIKKIIWKNIINYILKANFIFCNSELWVTYIYTNHQQIYVPIRWEYMDRDMILNKYNIESAYNLDKLWVLIISRFMLIDIIIIEHAIFDISNIIKELIYNIILIKN